MKTVFFSCLCLIFGAVSSVVADTNYIIVDNHTGHILASDGMNEKVQVASLTKIATAMVVLDWAQLRKEDLSQQATVPVQAAQTGGVNPAGLQPGDTVSLRDLVYCSLIASDNAAAITLAHHLGSRLPNSESLDPIGNFVAHMNALARNLKMTRTLFLNPSGFDGNESAMPYSTVADMARLTRYAYGEADFPFYVAQKSRVVHISRAGQNIDVDLRNTNELLGQEGIDGVKTGRTSRAGECVILSSERKPEVQRDGEKVFVTPRRVILVLVGSTDRFGMGLSLIRKGWGSYDQWAAEGRKTKGNSTL